MEFLFDATNSDAETLLARDIMRRREDGDLVQVSEAFASKRVDPGHLLDLVTEHFDPDDRLVVRRMHLDRVTAHTEFRTHQVHVVALVLHVDERPQDVALINLLSSTQVQQMRFVLLGGAKAIDTRHRRHDDRVPPRQQGARGRVPQPVDLVVYRRVLLDVRVARGHIRLGLVVVVVADEVLHPVLREELAQLVRELSRERLVWRDDQRGSLHLLDRPRDRRALA